ncbi:hypothetical protein WR25_09424 [Diploscapter pachys]|uniref:PARP catalytic domain-containing protein n=1 Tax=Diploscapter pachys TaxID=2018661 RepID=A0A2A2LM51_9BILA|nr:hypothetical protein WR25_09424 [Diploscapter pachys]
MDRSRMPDFYDSQNKEIKMIIAAIFEKSTDLEEFARIIMSMKSALNNPDAFDKWLKNEEIELKEPSIQKAAKKESPRGGGFPAYRIEKDLFDPDYNRDFTNVKDTGRTFTRGGREYFRPIGSRRFAIKVLGKYEDDKWLGSSGDASTGEWPVAYHSTQESNALDIVKQGFDTNKCRRFAYGKGIFCTPDPRTALAYGNNLDYNGKSYRMIFQLRVDPSKIEVVKKKDSQMGEYWIVPNEDSIRAYGICCFPVD